MSEGQDPSVAEVTNGAKNMSLDQAQSNSLVPSLALRGPRSNTIEAGKPRLDPQDLAYIEKAIEDGDNLLDSRNKKVEPCARRALIVAPLYLDYAMLTGFSEYGSINVRLNYIISGYAFIYSKQVERYGYERGNIRILTDGFNRPEYLETTNPTRNNILMSLDWLVNGARSTDHRFFHFSGHGKIQPTREGEGKLARVMLPVENTPSTDHERHLQQRGSRIESQVVLKGELGYFEEAILTRTSYDSSNPGEIVYYITDQELNQKFSTLPSGCHLTCLMDVSLGRMIGDNAIKLGGSGFRGRPTPAVVGLEGEPKAPEEVQLQEGVQVSEETQAQGEAQAPGQPDETLSDENKSVAGDFCIGDKVYMFEELPKEEKARDNIIAETLTWGASHQRQRAGHSLTFKCGLLTEGFCKLLSTNTNDKTKITVKDLHTQLDKHVQEKSFENPQYVQTVQQVRMSPKNTPKERQDEIWKGEVDI
ncbi:ICE-like protease (caspase) p20 domain protein [Ceratobasidium sp. AG-Ba]|nr:ICE-like protease (caspase) p20 domain protein [Ceratobasidium sp. AG-Ba]